MGKRKQIGLIFKNNPNWTGGVYYILNLIRSLKQLKPEEQPDIFLFCDHENDFNLVSAETNYPFLHKVLVPEKITYNFFERSLNIIWRKFTGKNFFEKRFNQPLDILFPYTYNYFFDLVPNKVYWLPDFQDRYLPQFFTNEEIASRLAYQEYLSKGEKKIVFSSQDAHNDYSRFFPNHDSRVFVLRFASTGLILPDAQEKEKIKKKFNLPTHFFYAPNQFWAHKNHKTLIDAVEILCKKGRPVNVYFSGNEKDYRNPGFIGELKQMVIDKNLSSTIFFLGFIERQEVFALMEMAAAVIQPSFFEGWSTVVEDAKSVNAYILASDLSVHREQLDKNASFFPASDSHALAALMEKQLENPSPRIPFDYKQHITAYANQFMEMATEFSQTW